MSRSLPRRQRARLKEREAAMEERQNMERSGCGRFDDLSSQRQGPANLRMPHIMRHHQIWINLLPPYLRACDDFSDS